MARDRYVKEGPNRKHYSMSPSANKEIDSGRQYLSNSQSKTTKRDRLGSEVSREGGKVYWNNKEQEKETVLPYTKIEHEKLKLREEKVASKIKELADKYNIQNMNKLNNAYDIDEFLTGKANFKIGYTAGGQLYIEEAKDKGKAHTITESNSVLRNLERYVNQVEKMKSFEKRHGNKSELEATASAVTAILGIGIGLSFLSSNITGNAIAEPIGSNLGIIGTILLSIGLIGIFFYLRKK